MPALRAFADRRAARSRASTLENTDRIGPVFVNRPGHNHEAPESSSIRFATTIWGQVLAAGDEQASEHEVALESVCQRYWPPIYAYLRKKGHSPDEAKDLTQAFFEFLLEHHTLTRADPARGRFRSFLLTVLENFVSNTWSR